MKNEIKIPDHMIQKANKLGIEVPLFGFFARVSMDLESNLMADLIVNFGLSSGSRKYKEAEKRYNLYRSFAIFYGEKFFEYRSSG